MISYEIYDSWILNEIMDHGRWKWYLGDYITPARPCEAALQSFTCFFPFPFFLLEHCSVSVEHSSYFLRLHFAFDKMSIPTTEAEIKAVFADKAVSYLSRKASSISSPFKACCRSCGGTVLTTEILPRVHVQSSCRGHLLCVSATSPYGRSFEKTC